MKAVFALTLLVSALQVVLVLGVELGSSSLRAKFPKAESESADKVLEAEQFIREKNPTKRKRNFHSVNPVVGDFMEGDERGLHLGEKYAGVVFSHLSPRWFAIEAGEMAESGVNLTWCTSVRTRGAKVIPRIALGGPQETGKLKDILRESGERVQALIGLLATLTTKYRDRFDGFLLHVDPTLYGNPGVRFALVELFKQTKEAIAKEFGEDGKLFLLVPAGTVHLSHKEVGWLQPEVDFLILDTDVSAQEAKREGTGPTTSLSIVEKELSFLGLAKGKSLIGVPLSGYKFSVQNEPSPLAAQEYLEILGRVDPTKLFFWDDEAAEHTFEFYRPKVGPIIVYYPTRASVLHRLQIAKENGIGAYFSNIEAALELLLYQV